MKEEKVTHSPPLPKSNFLFFISQVRASEISLGKDRDSILFRKCGLIFFVQKMRISAPPTLLLAVASVY